MEKSIIEHEDRYWHINKGAPWIIPIGIVGLYLLITNIALIVKAHPIPPSYVAIPSILLWVFVVVCLVGVSIKICNR